MKNRNFIVTIKVKMSGEVPDNAGEGIVEDAIIDNIDFDTEFRFGEDENEVFFIKAKEDSIEVIAEQYSITYSDNPSCEHCGDRHSSYAATINIGGINWCINCANSYENFSGKEVKDILKEEKKGLKKYYQSKLKELDE